MEGEGEEGLRLSKRFSDKEGGEVDYRTKSGTAWSHNFLNQKPWHPLSYPNQRRKWIAEQTHAQRHNRAQEVAREYAQEQDFFRQTALISKKDREKVEMMKAVSFMYVRPPGYNAESAKVAEIADEKKKAMESNSLEYPQADGDPEALTLESNLVKDNAGEEKKKRRPKDVFGRTLPTEEEFEILKNAPRHETGIAGRAKPFAVELRNVKCLRCGNYGHQSGDRECPLKDAIMPNEENRLKRDDPLTAIMAHVDPSEPLKWELKQQPGLSPPRGGFKPDDPNQQIVAEDIFDEYGGFLNGDNIPGLLTNISSVKLEKSSRKSRKQKSSLQTALDVLLSSSDCEEQGSKKKKKRRKTKQKYSDSDSSEELECDRHTSKSSHRHLDLADERKKHSRQKQNSNAFDHIFPLEDSESSRHHKSKRRREHSVSSDDDSYRHNQTKKDYSYRHNRTEKSGSHKHNRTEKDDSYRNTRTQKEDSYRHNRTEKSDSHIHSRFEKRKHKHTSYTSEDSDIDCRYRSRKSKERSPCSSEVDFDCHKRTRKSVQKENESSRHHRTTKTREKHSYSSEEETHRYRISKNSRQTR